MLRAICYTLVLMIVFVLILAFLVRFCHWLIYSPLDERNINYQLRKQREFEDF